MCDTIIHHLRKYSSLESHFLLFYKSNDHCHLLKKYIIIRYLVLYKTIISYRIVNLSEFLWRCILWKQLEKSLAVILGCMSFAILLAEATILTSGVDLSLFSILVHAGGRHEGIF